MTAPRVRLISIGTEMLQYGRVDTNGPELGARFARMGFRVEGLSCVGDELQPLTRAFREEAARAELLISTGGLGPTCDDRTREALAGAFGRTLHADPELLRGLEERFRAWGREMPESNRQQAQVPDGARPLPNPEGSAPGLWLDHPGGVVLALPGPPWEVRAVLGPALIDAIRDRFRPRAAAERMVRASGIGESALQDRIADLGFAEEGAELTILARPGLVEVLIRVEGEDAARGDATASRLAKQVAARLGAHVFATDDRSVAAVVGERLRTAGGTVAVAESCTAGLLGAELTSEPGASDYFLGGVLAYTNEAKEKLLSVPPDLLRTHGAVSEEVAAAMARGARDLFGARFGVAITGIAGPGGGSAAKPVGCVYHAVAGPSATSVRHRQWTGARDRVRRWAVAAALDLLRRTLEEP